MKASDILVQALTNCDDDDYFCCERLDLGVRPIVSKAIEAIERLKEDVNAHCVDCSRRAHCIDCGVCMRQGVVV